MRPWLLGVGLVSACSILALAVLPAVAQQAPLLPDQQDPVVTHAIADYVAGLGLTYAGDCQLATADQSGQMCSLQYDQADQSIYVTLSLVQADGSAGAPVDSGTVQPAPPPTD
jgi:hypothetical protein